MSEYSVIKSDYDCLGCANVPAVGGRPRPAGESRPAALSPRPWRVSWQLAGHHNSDQRDVPPTAGSLSGSGLVLKHRLSSPRSSAAHVAGVWLVSGWRSRLNRTPRPLLPPTSRKSRVVMWSRLQIAPTTYHVIRDVTMGAKKNAAVNTFFKKLLSIIFNINNK